MKKNKIKKHINEFLKKIHLLSTSSAKHFRKEEIHKLRVEIKKLRALLRLMNASPDKLSELKISKSIRTFYRCAGDIRNIQNHISWVKAFFKDKELPSSYISFLKMVLKEYKRSLQASIPSNSQFKSNRNKILNGLPAEISVGVVASFMNHKKIEIKKLLGSQKTDQVLHALRKELKDIDHNKSLLQQYINLAELPVINMMKELLQLLGSHQDYVIHLGYLTSFEDGKSDPKGKKMLQSARNEALKNKSTLRNQILQKISG